MAGLRVGQAFRMLLLPGFGIQPPCVTRALNISEALGAKTGSSGQSLSWFP